MSDAFGHRICILKLPFHVISSHTELPRQKLLIFPCGVEVEVSFSALFSNVMVAFGTVKTTGPRTQDCTVTLRSTPVSHLFTLTC